MDKANGHIRRTSLRTDEMHDTYVNTKKDPNFYENAESLLEYEFWRVIQNQFPYDTIATTHDLLIPKRQVVSELHLTSLERVELYQIKSKIIEDQAYDMLVWNFPHQQSAPSRLHYHLIVVRHDNGSET